MQNLLSTSLENIKKFVNIICEIYEQYDDEKNKFFHHWYHKKSFQDFLNIVKNEKLNYVSKDNDKWIIEIQNKFNDKIKDFLIINWEDERVNFLLKNIYEKIILESELFIKNKRENFVFETKKINFCKKNLSMFSPQNLKTEDFDNKIWNELDFLKTKEADFVQEKFDQDSYNFYRKLFWETNNFFYAKYLFVCRSFLINSDLFKNIESMILKNKNSLWRTQSKSISITFKRILVLGMNNILDESALFFNLRKLFDNTYQIKHKKTWKSIREERSDAEKNNTEYINEINNLFERIPKILEENQNLFRSLTFWFFGSLNKNSFSLFKNENFKSKFIKFLNFYSHNDGESRFFNENSMVLEHTLIITENSKENFRKVWYYWRFYLDYFDNFCKNNLLFFLKQKEIDEIRFYLIEKIKKRFGFVLIKKFLQGIWWLNGFLNEFINRVLSKKENFVKEWQKNYDFYAQYFGFLNKEIKWCEIKSRNDLNLLLDLNEIQSILFKVEVLFLVQNNEDKIKKYKDIINSFKNFSEKLLINEIDKFNFFKTVNNITLEQEQINFYNLHQFITDDDLMKIQEKYINKDFANGICDFFGIIEWIKDFPDKFIPLILLANGIILKNDFFKILNIFKSEN